MIWSNGNTEAEPLQPAPRILIVEDEPLIRMTISATLRDLSACVIEASSADEAWNYLTSGGSVDLVFSDHRMPGSITGAQLARRIRERFPQVRVVLTSAFLDDKDWLEPVVTKPYDLFKVAFELVRVASEARDQEFRP